MGKRNQEIQMKRWQRCQNYLARTLSLCSIHWGHAFHLFIGCDHPTQCYYNYFKQTGFLFVFWSVKNKKNKISLYLHLLFFHYFSSFFNVDSSLNLYNFPPAWRTSNLSYKFGLLVRHSLSCACLWKSLFLYFEGLFCWL